MERTKQPAPAFTRPEGSWPSPAEPTLDAPLLVLSFPRSGTTLLRAMLNSHPDMAVLPEPWWMAGLMKALRRETRPLTRGLATSYLAAHIAGPWYTAAGISLEEIVTLLPSWPMRGADVISAIGTAYARRFGKERWGAKYPGSEFRRTLPLMHATFPSATFVFLARDVRDVYLSQVAAGLRQGTEDLDLYCFLWVLQTRKILQDFERMGDRALVLRYEDLLEAPQESLTRICEAACLSTAPATLEGMLSYHNQLQGKVRKNPIHRNLQAPVLVENRRKFVSQLSPEQIRRTEILGRAMLEALGYADGRTESTLLDRLSAAAYVAPRLAVNLWRNYLGKSTLSGMELKRRPTV